MAITSFWLTTKRKGNGKSTRKGLITEIINRTYINQYVVQTNDLADGPQTVRAHASCPAIGDSYVCGNDADVLATCTDVDVDADAENPYVWHVTATYDTDRLIGVAIDNPLNLPPEVSWSYAKYEKPLVRDATGVPLVNSSKEAFDPGVMYNDARPVLSVVRNEASFDPAIALAYQEACNTDIFAGAGPRCAKLTTMSGQKQVDIGSAYYKVTYEIEFRRETFDIQILDQGFRDLNRNIFRDPRDFAPLANPTLMNGKGVRLTDATTTLTASVDAEQFTIPVADGTTKFPPGPTVPPHHYFEIRVDNEVMQVLAGFSSNTWIVTRGYAGTTAASHSNGATVRMEPYYLRFQPHRLLPFATLALPTS